MLSPTPPCLQDPLVLDDGHVADQPQRLGLLSLLTAFLHHRRGSYPEEPSRGRSEVGTLSVKGNSSGEGGAMYHLE